MNNLGNRVRIRRTGEKPVAAHEMRCMLHYIPYITSMARGDSGRIVIEVEPEMKRRLYAALALSGSTLKGWFVKSAEGFCEEAGQLSLFGRLPATATPTGQTPPPVPELEEKAATKSK